jgi:hypothetical protein
MTEDAFEANVEQAAELMEKPGKVFPGYPRFVSARFVLPSVVAMRDTALGEAIERIEAALADDPGNLGLREALIMRINEWNRRVVAAGSFWLSG